MLIENLLGEEKSIEILFKHFCIPLVIQSANDITVNNLVFWRTINSKLPDILTTPVILRSPTEGKSLLSAKDVYTYLVGYIQGCIESKEISD